MKHRQLCELQAVLSQDTSVSRDTLRAISFIAHKNSGNPTRDEICTVLRSAFWSSGNSHSKALIGAALAKHSEAVHVE